MFRFFDSGPVGLIIAAVCRARHICPADPRTLKLLLLFGACLVAAVVPSILLVHPRHHYLAPLWLFFLVILCVLFRRKAAKRIAPPPTKLTRPALGACLIVAAIALTPAREGGLRRSLRWESQLLMANTVRCLVR